MPQLSAGFLGTRVLLRCDAEDWGVSWGGWGGAVGVGWLHCFLGRAICNKLCAWNAQVHPSIYIYIYVYVYIYIKKYLSIYVYIYI